LTTILTTTGPTRSGTRRRVSFDYDSQYICKHGILRYGETLEGERVRVCKLPGCLRMIDFEPYQLHPTPGSKTNVRAKYKTRIDRFFCKGRGCKQKYHYRKNAGWTEYY
jgi:hypothetical protein